MHMASLYIQLRQYDLLQINPQPEPEPNSRSTRSENNRANCCTLLIALNHGISLYTNGIVLDLRQGSCILLQPEQSYHLEAIRGQATAICFTFQAFEVEGTALRPISCPPLLSAHVYSLPFSTLKAALAVENWAYPSPMREHSQERGPLSAPELAILQARLQLVLSLIAQLEQAPSPQLHSKEAVQRTLSHMEQHYNEDLSVERLAEMAGMVRWKYSSTFKALTGKKPTDYLAELRVNQAKHLLASSTEPLREISRQVGFKDEYYFSRRFQQLTGCPPREYANIQRRAKQRTITDSLGRQVRLPEAATRIVATGTHTLGELLVIGICPVGAGIATMKSQVVYRNKLQHVRDIGLQADPEQVSPLKPDLMLLGNYREQQLSQLDAIAPTIVYRDTNNTYERLRYIAGLFDRDKAADQWIGRYESGIRRIRRQLEDQYSVGEIATVYLALGNKVYVMGQNGFAVTLYESLGFRPSAPVQSLIENDKAWIQIEHHEISHYLGDRNFVLAPAEELHTSSTCAMLTSVASFTSDKVHLVDACWNYEDPITRERLLAFLPSIFSRTKRVADLK